MKKNKGTQRKGFDKKRIKIKGENNKKIKEN